MNEEELKKLWQKDQTAPQIDFAGLQKLSDDWHNRLRRKARIDAWAQGTTAVVCLLPVFYYPKMILASVLVFIFGVWYVRELRGLYKPENSESDYIAVKQSLGKKILTMKNYFRRTRIVMYVLTPLILPAAYYGLGIFDKPSDVADRLYTFIITLVMSEIAVVIATEIYFKILYTPALKELENLQRQLDSDE